MLQVHSDDVLRFLRQLMQVDISASILPQSEPGCTQGLPLQRDESQPTARHIGVRPISRDTPTAAWTLGPRPGQICTRYMHLDFGSGSCHMHSRDQESTLIRPCRGSLHFSAPLNPCWPPTAVQARRKAGRCPVLQLL